MRFSSSFPSILAFSLPYCSKTRISDRTTKNGFAAYLLLVHSVPGLRTTTDHPPPPSQAAAWLVLLKAAVIDGMDWIAELYSNCKGVLKMKKLLSCRFNIDTACECQRIFEPLANEKMSQSSYRTENPPCYYNICPFRHKKRPITFYSNRSMFTYILLWGITGAAVADRQAGGSRR